MTWPAPRWLTICTASWPAFPVAPSTRTLCRTGSRCAGEGPPRRTSRDSSPRNRGARSSYRRTIWAGSTAGEGMELADSGLPLGAGRPLGRNNQLRSPNKPCRPSLFLLTGRSPPARWPLSWMASGSREAQDGDVCVGHGLGYRLTEFSENSDVLGHCLEHQGLGLVPGVPGGDEAGRVKCRCEPVVRACSQPEAVPRNRSNLVNRDGRASIMSHNSRFDRFRGTAALGPAPGHHSPSPAPSKPSPARPPSAPATQSPIGQLTPLGVKALGWTSRYGQFLGLVA
jgi:hypothetical protein